MDDVERRVRDYEQGHIQFGPNEDAHVIGDCIKVRASAQLVPQDDTNFSGGSVVFAGPYLLSL